MSKCNFSVPFQGSAEDLYNKAKQQMENYGGTFNGDLTHGDFHVKVMGMTVSGSYKVTGQQMDLEVTEKPIFVSCKQLENYLSAYLVGNK